MVTNSENIEGSTPSILIVDNEPSMLEYAKTLLEMRNCSVETATSGEEAIRRVECGPAIDLILLDRAMPPTDGLQTIQACKKLRPEQQIVVCSFISDTNKVIEAIKLGALDYAAKPFYRAELDTVAKRSLTANHPEDSTRYKQPPADREEYAESLEDDLFFLAASPAMKRIRAQISLVAKVDVPVMLLGESGVGKEVLARLIHKLSHRARNPLVKVNCAALPADLLESELFGYELGAFKGATRSKPGKFELCNKGMILLDEIGEMSPVLQEKLLHVLQHGHFFRLGSRTAIAADFRVLATTGVDVQKALTAKTIREDLYYRLNAFSVSIPPLRERQEEIPLLFKHFLNRLKQKYAHPSIGYSDKLIQTCLQYRWPGNLRELENFVMRYMVLQDEQLAISELESKVKSQVFDVGDFDNRFNEALNTSLADGDKLASTFADLPDREAALARVCSIAKEAEKHYAVDQIPDHVKSPLRTKKKSE